MEEKNLLNQAVHLIDSAYSGPCSADTEEWIRVAGEWLGLVRNPRVGKEMYPNMRAELYGGQLRIYDTAGASCSWFIQEGEAKGRWLLFEIALLDEEPRLIDGYDSAREAIDAGRKMT